MMKSLNLVTCFATFAIFFGCGDSATSSSFGGNNSASWPEGSTSSTTDTMTMDEPETTTGKSTNPIDETTTGEPNETTADHDQTTEQMKMDVGLEPETDTQAWECLPEGVHETVCNRIDDDCNGIVDDIDLGEDGICDCLRVGLFGKLAGYTDSNFPAWLESKGVVVIDLTDEPTIYPWTLEEVDVVIIQKLTKYHSLLEGTELEKWIEMGGGVVMLNGYSSNNKEATKPYNNLLSTMNVAFYGEEFSDSVTDWVEHPVTQNLESIYFSFGYPIHPLNMMSGAQPIAWIQDDVVGMAEEKKEGRMILWGDNWITYDDQVDSEPDIVQFWQNMLGWVTPEGLCTLRQ